ncbi:hypothetical protein MRX96_043625 [Rhipicephalus microplus]
MDSTSSRKRCNNDDECNSDAPRKHAQPAPSSLLSEPPTAASRCRISCRFQQVVMEISQPSTTSSTLQLPQNPAAAFQKKNPPLHACASQRTGRHGLHARVDSDLADDELLQSIASSAPMVPDIRIGNTVTLWFAGPVPTDRHNRQHLLLTREPFQRNHQEYDNDDFEAYEVPQTYPWRPGLGRAVQKGGEDASFLISVIFAASLLISCLSCAFSFLSCSLARPISSSSPTWGELRFYSSPLGGSRLPRALSAQESVGFLLLEVVGVRERDLVSPDETCPRFELERG